MIFPAGRCYGLVSPWERGIAFMETAVCLSVIFPFLVVALGIWDYEHIRLSAMGVVERNLSRFPMRAPLKIEYSTEGDPRIVPDLGGMIAASGRIFESVVADLDSDAKSGRSGFYAQICFGIFEIDSKNGRSTGQRYFVCPWEKAGAHVEIRPPSLENKVEREALSATGDGEGSLLASPDGARAGSYLPYSTAVAFRLVLPVSGRPAMLMSNILESGSAIQIDRIVRLRGDLQ